MRREYFSPFELLREGCPQMCVVKGTKVLGLGRVVSSDQAWLDGESRLAQPSLLDKFGICLWSVSNARREQSR